MLSDVVLIHRKGSQPFQVLTEATLAGDQSSFDGWYLWPTCLRQVALGSVHALGTIELHPEDQIHRGLDAYRICFEIACGLHSPLVGETEVFGQFKKAAESWNLPNNPIGLELRRFVQALLADVKKVRSRYLADLGSQSYGSLLRRELGANRDIHIVGAGQLVEEILPWLCKDGTKVFVHVRNLARTEALQAKFSHVRFRQLDDNQFGSDVGGFYKGSGFGQVEAFVGALIVAAPVSAIWLRDWMRKSGANFEQIADLRGNASVDRIVDAVSKEKPSCSSSGNQFGIQSGTQEGCLASVSLPVVVELEKLIQQMVDNQEQIEGRKLAALAEIESLVLARGRHIEYRPFGWEDVCA